MSLSQAFCWASFALTELILLLFYTRDYRPGLLSFGLSDLFTLNLTTLSIQESTEKKYIPWPLVRRHNGGCYYALIC